MSGLIYRYLFTLVQLVRLLVTGPFSLTGRRELGRLALSVGWLRHSGSLTDVSLDTVTRGAPPVELFGLDANEWNTTTTELAIIAMITRRVGPMRIFEFGTYDGRTTATMLLNAPDTAHAWTIDLPQGRPRSGGDSQPPVGARLLAPRDAARFAGRYTQLTGDSRTFDLSEHLGLTDLIFIDGGHSHEVCLSDSRNALRMVSPRGIILWHDYATAFPGVTRAIDEVAATLPSGRRIVHVAGCSLAVCVPDGFLN